MSTFSDMTIKKHFALLRSITATYISNTFNNNTTTLDLSHNIIPVTSDMYDLGKLEYQFKDLYISGNTIYIDNVPMSNINQQYIDGSVNLPVKSLVGGIDPLSIKIKGVLYNTNELLTKIIANASDAYIINSNLWVSSKASPKKLTDWTNLGVISGPKGPRGDKGLSGPKGPTGDNGILKVRTDNINLNFKGSIGQMIFYNNYIYIYNGNTWSMMKMDKI